MAQRPQGSTSSARNGKRESFLFSGSQENRRAHPPLFFPDHRRRATSCISWRRITPGQHRQQAAAILHQMRTEAAFLPRADISPHRLSEAAQQRTQAAGRTHPPPVSGSRQRATSCTQGGHSWRRLSQAAQAAARRHILRQRKEKRKGKRGKRYCKPRGASLRGAATHNLTSL